MAISATNGLLDIVSRAHRASKETGVSIVRQLTDSIRLRFSDCAIGFSEYFGYRLFDPATVAREDLGTFASEAITQQIWEGLNPKTVWGLASDKIAFQTMMVAGGYAQPKLVAFLDLDGRIAPGVDSFNTTNDLIAWLKSSSHYPMFCKPTRGLRSQGALGIASYDHAANAFSLTNGDSLQVAAFVDNLKTYRSYLIQELVVPDPSIADITGASLSTMRLVVLMRKNGPEIFRARWKIPTRKNMADNFWRLGNFLAELEPKSGRVSVILESAASGYEIVGEDSEMARRFLGEVAPQYEQALATCLQASRLFTMFSYQSWDIALTADGPLALELNHNGDVELLQLGAKVGIYDDQFKALLDERGLKLMNRRKRVRLFSKSS